MTYLSGSGISFAGGHTTNGDVMLWGKPPAAMIEAAIQRLIARLYAERRRYPTVAEIDENVYGPIPAPEIVEGMTYAACVFREDVGRDPTPAELFAGLVLVDTQAALFTFLELDIQVGDRVMWPKCDANGARLHQTIDGRDDMIVPAFGTVTAQPDGWHRDNTILCDDGRIVSIGRASLIKVSS